MSTISSLVELVDSQPNDRYITSSSGRNFKISPYELNNLLFYNSIGTKNDYFVSESFSSVNPNISYARNGVGTYTNPDGVSTTGIVNEPRLERLVDTSIGLLLDTATGTAASSEYASLNAINSSALVDFTLMIEFSNISNVSFAPVSNRGAVVSLPNDFRIISGLTDAINIAQNEITISAATLNAALPINKLTVRYDGSNMDVWLNSSLLISPVNKQGSIFKQDTFYFGEYNGVLNHGHIRNFRLYDRAISDDQIKLF